MQNAKRETPPPPAPSAFLSEAATGFPVFRRVWRGVLDVVFPRDCALLNVPVCNPPWRYLSAAGLAALERVKEPCCRTCGFPFYGAIDEPHQCPHCFALSPVFGRGKVAVLAKGAGRRLVHLLKYHRAVWLAEDMARVMATTAGFAEYLAGATIVPVPLHSERRRWRGFNQAQVLAVALGRLLRGHEVRVAANLVRRVRNTQTQTFLGREERVQNLRGAFTLAPDVTLDLGMRYVVLDDVFTTGATLNACCKTLAAAGATQIDIAAFAHG